MAGLLVLQGGGPFAANDDLDRRLLDGLRKGSAGRRPRVVVLPTADAFENPADLVVAAMSWAERVDVDVEALMVLTRDEVPMKPDPTGILTAMTEIGVGPERTVMVGDSWMDGTSALAAGVPFIGFRPRPGLLEERGVAYWAIVEQLTDLVPLLAGPWPVAVSRPA